MATGRTKDRWNRVYVDGYDLSGYSRSIGPLETVFDETDLTVWTDSTKGYLSGHPQANIGTLNGIFDNTATSGIHAVMGTSGIERVVMVAQGIRAAPAAGDPVFCGQFLQAGYQAQDDGGAAAVTIPFAGWAGDASTRLYPMGWGYLLHASGSR